MQTSWSRCKKRYEDVSNISYREIERLYDTKNCFYDSVCIVLEPLCKRTDGIDSISIFLSPVCANIFSEVLVLRSSRHKMKLVMRKS